MRRFTLVVTIGVVSAWLSFGTPAHAVPVTQLEFTQGAVNGGGKYHKILDRLLGQDGAVTLGEYQAIGEIVPSIDKGPKTFSLFTSGFTLAPPPSAQISGSSIEVDLSALFFGISKGDSHHVLNIGGLATGLFDPDTHEFLLSWDRLFDGGKKGNGQATFFLRGVVHTDVQPIPLPAGLALYATGLFGLSSWAWWRRRATLPVAA